jgi:fructokinase
VIIIVGENVVDLLPAGDGLLRPAWGGGPANTAIAAATIGGDVAFAARFGNDTFGDALRRRQAEAGVDLRYARDIAAPTALALASLAADGSASYDFWLDGAADFAIAPLPEPAKDDVVHIGSLAAFWPPGAELLESWFASHHGQCVCSVDINLRPVVLATQPDARARLDRLVRVADVVKASNDDFALAYPDQPPVETARRLVEAPDGPRLVVMTLGAGGITALRRDDAPVHVDRLDVAVADTIGAGDAAMGALLTRLDEIGLDGVCRDPRPTLEFVNATAALACTRSGAYAPTRAEVTAMLARISSSRARER